LRFGCTIALLKSAGPKRSFASDPGKRKVLTMNSKERSVLVRLGRSVVLIAGLGLMSAQTPPDNTKMNKGDASRTAETADHQSMNAADRTLSQKIRKSVMADKSLSTYAHNVNIISQSGMVTLKGPVRTEDEKKSLVAKAVEVVGSADKVTDQMTVAPESK
jgi:hyperosmotically inducible periplasmic protein